MFRKRIEIKQAISSGPQQIEYKRPLSSCKIILQFYIKYNVSIGMIILVLHKGFT